MRFLIKVYPKNKRINSLAIGFVILDNLLFKDIVLYIGGVDKSYYL